MRSQITYRRGEHTETVSAFAPDTMLLDHLRLEKGATGTKEGCREGDCGACTVVIGRPGKNGRMDWRPVNSCILPLGAIDGAEIITVEDLAEGPHLHPVQQAFVDQHASQCGFCTPGFVMAIFALFLSGQAVTRAAITDQIAGNLCRCTGYRPIVDAALSVCDGTQTDRFMESELKRLEALKALPVGDVFVGTEDRFFAAPASLESLAKLYEAHPDATIVAGATDVGLWITKQYRDLPKLIYIGRVEDFAAIEDDPSSITIGAGATYRDAEDALARFGGDVSEMIRRLGSVQVRASGTIGGNIANGSPIGDSPPMLIALGATLTLQKGAEIRTLPLEDFFLDYGKQDRAPGEFVRAITIPKPAANTHTKVYKISKRFDQDISAVLAAFSVTLEGQDITDFQAAFGGMAATPKRAKALEKALIGLSTIDETSVRHAAETALSIDFAPISDMRASSDYRASVAVNLVVKLCRELAGEALQQTRVLNAREAANG